MPDLEKKNDGQGNGKIVQELIRSDNTHLLQIAVVLLAVVSFFTTANGMSSYIFSGNAVIAYAASGAIQGILLALSMNLPEYIRSIWERKPSKTQQGEQPSPQSGTNCSDGKRKGTFGKVVLVFCTLVLTVVAIFCSSWFSYVYIAEVIHKDSWGVDSELLVQQNYRSELYNAQEYARTYRIYLEQAIGDKILEIEKQAENLEDNLVEFGLDWDEETTTYVTNGGAAAGYMASVINAMRSATAEGASQETRNSAFQALEDAEQNITARMESVRQNLDELDTRITTYNNQISNLTIRIRNAEEGTDTTELTNAINEYTRLISSATQQQTDFQAAYIQLDSARPRLPIYKNFLDRNNSTNAISIRDDLMEMQEALFLPDPNEEQLLKKANEIFERLHDAAGTVANVTEDQFSYTELLSQMNRLIQNLTDYAEIRGIETALRDLVTELRTEGAVPPEQAEPAEPADSPEPSESIEPSDSPEPSESIEPSDSPEPSESIEPSDSTTPSNIDNVPGASALWQQTWRSRIERLKEQISTMPTYGDSVEDSTLTSSQISILHGYDRDESSKALDDLTRRYISSHNAIYQGIIYLQSPYRSLAIFALILSLSFDLAGFVFGVVISGRPQTRSSALSMGSSEPAPSAFTAGQRSPVEWSILETLNQYKVLTGDYECRDDCYCYNVFCNGILEEWEVKKADLVYGRGIYKVDASKLSGAGFAVEMEQELLFAGQDKGPEDGVIRNCRLWFKDGSLMKKYEEKQEDAVEADARKSKAIEPKIVKKCTFVASIDEYVPFHIYSPARGVNRTVPALELDEQKTVNADIAVIALGEHGTRVAAVYIIEK